ncbi:MAG: DUF4105 domain-containing protein [Rhodoferax sp.]|nr:DUF4105 domain-containing protein [Rhodoferax sp.]
MSRFYLYPCAKFLLGTFFLCAQYAAAETFATASDSSLTPSASAYLQELQARARALQMAESPQWRAFLHYSQHPITRQWRSLRTDASFFISPRGRNDLAAELEADLAAFFQPLNAETEKKIVENTQETGDSEKLPQHPQCRFVARFQWLRQVLQIDDRMPQSSCPRYAYWREAINPDQVVLLFASAYLNNPSSMYGHTFLRVDPPAVLNQPVGLSYTISYAAHAPKTDGVSFAFKGLAGFYPGLLSSPPYYLKLREYSVMENRDLWEYHLNLNQTQTERLLQHTWEISNSRFNYYFFDDNCAQMLLYLLDVADPELKLAGQFVWNSIPSDTVKAVEKTGLVRKSIYRPSEQSILTAQSQSMLAADVQAVKDYASGLLKMDQLKTDDPVQTAQRFELADKYFTYLGIKGEVGVTELKQRLFELRSVRSVLPTPPEIKVPPPEPPEVGHPSARLRLQQGFVEGLDYTEIGIRPAFHDLLDPPHGFSAGAEIEFLDVALRNDRQQGLQLQRIKAVSIRSAVPGVSMLTSTSWEVAAGWNRFLSQSQNPLSMQISGGVGRTWQLRQKWTWTHQLIADSWFTSEWDRGYDAGLGYKVNTFLDWHPKARLEVSWDIRQYGPEHGLQGQTNIAQRWQVSPQVSVLGLFESARNLPNKVSIEMRVYF